MVTSDFCCHKLTHVLLFVFLLAVKCEEMKPAEFATVITALPYEVTITVLRRKERVTGKFG